MTPLKQLERLYIEQHSGDCVNVPRELVERLLEIRRDRQASVQMYLKERRILTPTELTLFSALLKTPGHPVSKRDLLTATGAASIESLWVHVYRMRDKINPQVAEVHAVTRFGYMVELRG